MSKYLLILLLALAIIGGWAYRSSTQERADIGAPVLSVVSESTAKTDLAKFTNGTYRLDSNASVMTWVGSKTLIKDYFDRGTVKLSKGSTIVRDGSVASGSITVDLTTISTTSTGKGSGESSQTTHLKSTDFFDVEKFPTAEFSLKSISAEASGSFKVEGSLTMRGIEKPVSFRAGLRQDGQKLIMEALNIALDRTQWDLRYASGKFFKNLGDKVINDIFTVSFTAVGVLQR